MLDKILQIIAPHHCYFCNYLGNVLCDSCIYNIGETVKIECIGCRKPTKTGTCVDCKLNFSKTWVACDREGEIAKVIGDFKWLRVYDAHRPLAQLLDQILPILPKNTVIVPIPTISRHIRLRGYDHADLIADTLARRRKLLKQKLLLRSTNSVQHKANKSQRKIQAESAFYCTKKLDPAVPYLIIDDIVTTGSTVNAAAKVLKNCGAKEIWVAAIARQPLS